MYKESPFFPEWHWSGCAQQPTSPRAWRLAGPIWSTSRTSSSSWWTRTTMVSGRWQSSLWRWLSSHRPTEDPALHLRFMFFSFILGSRSQFWSKGIRQIDVRPKWYLQKIPLLQITISGWNLWTFNLMNQSIKVQ